VKKVVLRSVNGRCGCRVDELTRDGKRVEIVAVACDEHREYEGRTVADHPNRDDFAAALADEYLRGVSKA
jgi:hypothetical protein